MARMTRATNTTTTPATAWCTRRMICSVWLRCQLVIWWKYEKQSGWCMRFPTTMHIKRCHTWQPLQKPITKAKIKVIVYCVNCQWPKLERHSSISHQQPNHHWPNPLWWPIRCITLGETISSRKFFKCFSTDILWEIDWVFFPLSSSVFRFVWISVCTAAVGMKMIFQA